MAVGMKVSKKEEKAKRRLWDIQPTRVDVVDAAANAHTFLVCKKEQSMAPQVKDTQDSSLEATLVALAEQVEGIKKALEPDQEATDGLTDAVAPAVLSNETAKAVQVVAKAAEELAVELEKSSDTPADLDSKLDALVNPLHELYTVKKRYGNAVCEKISSVASALYDVAWRVEEGLPVNEAIENVANTMALVKEVLESVVGKVDVEKSADSPKLPEDLTSEDPVVVKKAFVELVKALCYEAGALSWAIAETPDDKVKERITKFDADISALCDAVPTRAQKAAATLSNLLEEASTRAASLAELAKEKEYDNEEELKTLGHTQQVLKALQEKYVGIQKSADASDLGTVLSANALLNSFEEGLRRLGIIKTQDASGDEKQVEKEQSKSAEDVALQAQMAELTKQVASLATLVQKNKSDGKVPAPACTEVSDDANKGGVGERLPSPPDNYNDPAYIAKLKERGLR